MAQGFKHHENNDMANFNRNANRNFGGMGNPYDRNDDLAWQQREAYRHDFQTRSGDPRTVSQRYGTTSSSSGYSQWDNAVDRAVRGEGPAYNDRRPDREEPQSHRGRGPKNYQRSDARVQELVCERLTDDPGIDASNIEVKCAGGVVTLEGTIDSRRMKHRVEDLVADMPGVQDVDNRLHVSAFGSKGE